MPTPINLLKTEMGKPAGDVGYMVMTVEDPATREVFTLTGEYLLTSPIDEQMQAIAGGDGFEFNNMP